MISNLFFDFFSGPEAHVFPQHPTGLGVKSRKRRKEYHHQGKEQPACSKNQVFPFPVFQGFGRKQKKAQIG
jgi:hypothetical protein